MKRLINKKLLKVKILINLYNDFNTNEKIASINNSNLELLKIAKNILNFKIKQILANIDPLDFSIYFSEISDIADNFYDFQDKKTDDRIKLTPEQLSINRLKVLLPQCLKEGIGYRGLSLEKKKIDINNIDNSIKSIIITGMVESWSFSKQFVDDISKNKAGGRFNKILDIPVKISANIIGVHLPTFWKYFLQDYYKNDKKSFDEKYSGIYEDFQYEDEILAITPNNYEIYNLDEIKKILNKEI